MEKGAKPFSIRKGENEMYQIIIAWDDCSCKTEHGNDILSVLRAAEIYIEDPHVNIIHIWDCSKKKDVFTWSR